jgi:hypothetical protein
MEQILEHPDEKEVGLVVLFDNGSATSDIVRRGRRERAPVIARQRLS